MRGVLLGLEPLRRDAAIHRDHRPHAPARLGDERADVLRSGLRERDEIGRGGGRGHGGHRKLRVVRCSIDALPIRVDPLFGYPRLAIATPTAAVSMPAI